MSGGLNYTLASPVPGAPVVSALWTALSVPDLFSSFPLAVTMTMTVEGGLRTARLLSAPSPRCGVIA